MGIGLVVIVPDGVERVGGLGYAVQQIPSLRCGMTTDGDWP